MTTIRNIANNFEKKGKHVHRRIKKLKHNSDFYGSCERCGQYCDTVHVAQFSTNNTDYTCVSFGHLDCLKQDYPEFT